MEHENPVHVVTFGYLHGAPPSAHLTVDLRVHFRDPNGNPALRHLTARDDAVYEAVRTTPGIEPLLDGIERTVLAYLAGPSAGPITIAIGCAGGRHRAATVGDLLAYSLAETHGLDVTLTHRDMDKPVVHRDTGTGSTDINDHEGTPVKHTGATIHHDRDDEETGMWCWVCGDDDHNPRPSCVDD